MSPSRRPSSNTIRQSGQDSPTGSITAFCRNIGLLRIEARFSWVFSKQLVAGRTMSAILAVSFMNRSMTTRCSTAPKARRVRVVSAMVTTGLPDWTITISTG